MEKMNPRGPKLIKIIVTSDKKLLFTVIHEKYSYYLKLSSLFAQKHYETIPNHC